MAGVLLEARPYRPFKSSEEYLYAMKEDLAEWLNVLYSDLDINVDTFMDKLETGVVLCKHANSIKKSAEEYVAKKHLRKMTSSQALTASIMTKTALPITKMGEIIYRSSAKPGTFFARDNVSNFIDFCRHGLEIIECLLFETDDLIMRKNEKNVILCLLEVARRGAKFGMLAPILVQMEREIDREIAAEQRLAGENADEDSSEDEETACIQYGPIPQIITNDLKSLDEMVRDLVEKCTCPTQFPMIRVSEGKYRIGDTKVLIFVRILRSHVMVRVGGGWDTLSHYLDKHDPCRCRTGHKAALSSKLILKNAGTIELHNAQVHYERSPPRTRRSSTSSSSSGQGGRDTRDYLSSYTNNRSRSPTPKRESARGTLYPQKFVSSFLFDKGQGSSISSKRGRSVSPGLPNQPSYNAPTLSSRNRSRSPSIRSPEKQKKKNLLASMAAKQTDARLPAAGQLHGDHPQRAKVLLEAKEPSNNDEGKQNDSGSEVSDEGYRSLGLIAPSLLIGEGKTGSNETKMPKIKHFSSLVNANLKENTNSRGTFDHASPFEDMNNRGERKTSATECPSDASKTLTQPVVKKIFNSRSSSPSGCNDRNSQLPVEAYPVTVNDREPCRRRGNKENELRKVPRSRSATASRNNSTEPQNSCTKSSVDTEKYGTWNGKSRKRSDNFIRNGIGRSSLNADGKVYDPATNRRVSKFAEQQKNMSPLLADLLKSENLDDDKTILLKMREIISQYSRLFDDVSEKKMASDLEELDFTSEWVRNNGSLPKLGGGGDFPEKASPNKRKDSKHSSHSKIPAPVFFKHLMSEKEC